MPASGCACMRPASHSYQKLCISACPYWSKTRVLKASSMARRWCSSSVSAEVSAAFNCGAWRPDCRRHHRLSVAGARTEAPLLHRLDGLLLKPESKPPRNPDVPQPAVGVHLAIEHHHALQLGFARFFGEFRLYLEKHHGSRSRRPPRQRTLLDRTHQTHLGWARRRLRILLPGCQPFGSTLPRRTNAWSSQIAGLSANVESLNHENQVSVQNKTFRPFRRAEAVVTRLAPHEWSKNTRTVKEQARILVRQARG